MGLHMFPHYRKIHLFLMPKKSRYPQGCGESTFLVENRTSLRIITKEYNPGNWKDGGSVPSANGDKTWEGKEEKSPLLCVIRKLSPLSFS